VYLAGMIANQEAANKLTSGSVLAVIRAERATASR